MQEPSALFFFFSKISSASATSNTVFLKAGNVILKLQNLDPFIDVDSESCSGLAGFIYILFGVCKQH